MKVDLLERDGPDAHPFRKKKRVQMASIALGKNIFLKQITDENFFCLIRLTRKVMK